MPVVRSGEGHVVDRRHAPPHVHERLGRRRVGRGIDEPDVRGQREGDPDETVLAKIAEVTGVLAVGPEIIRVDRPEQRIVGVRVPPAPPLQEPGTSPRRRRARAGSCPSPCGSRRTRARCRPARSASGRRTRGGRARPRRRARRRSPVADVAAQRRRAAFCSAADESATLALISRVEPNIRQQPAHNDSLFTVTFLDTWRNRRGMLADRQA